VEGNPKINKENKILLFLETIDAAIEQLSMHFVQFRK